MTDHDTFLRAIIAEPDDDLPRLIFADFLDERGEGERAEFIRVQCELATLVGDGSRRCACGWPTQTDEGCQADNRSFRPSQQSGKYAGWHKRQTQLYALRRRERELRKTPGSSEWIPKPVTDVARVPHPAIPWEFRRGFVAEVTISWQDWTTHHAAILAACPIRNARDGLVRLTTWPFPGQTWVDDAHHLAVLARDYPGVAFDLPRR
jgi:uncharacterized protein (TIGR02996 family)